MAFFNARDTDYIAKLNTLAGGGGVAGPPGPQGVPGVTVGSALTSGGHVRYVSALQFIVSQATYVINGTTYSSPETTINLTTADGSNPRIDVIALTSSSTAIAVDGVAASSPAEPTLDPLTQLRLTSILVATGATTIGVTTTNVYLENTEWTSSVSGGTVVANSTSNPHAGTKDIEFTAAAAGAYVNLSNGSAFDTSTRNFLSFYIRNKAAWPTNKSVVIQWYNGTTAVGTAVTFKNGTYGFNQANVSSYQLIGIPLSAFGVTGITTTAIRFTVTGSGTSIGFYLDDIVLQGGVVTITPTDAMRFRGTYSAAVQYQLNDVVNYSSATFIALKTALAITPVAGATWAAIGGSGAVTPSLTATYIGYGDGSNALTGTSDLSYITGTGILTLTKSVNSGVAIFSRNTNAGTSASASLSVANDVPDVSQFAKLSSAYTTAGLLVANELFISNINGPTVFYNLTAHDFVWARGGTAATNEVMRMAAGTLSLGRSGTTVGSIKFLNATSGDITLSPATGALGTIAQTLAATAGTIYPNSMTTEGDLVVAAASGVPSRLAAGSTSGHVLTSNGAGAAPSYQAVPAGSLTATYVGYGSGGNALTGEAAFNYDASTNTLTADNISDSKGGVRLIPQNSQSTAYPTVLADAGKHLLHPAADTNARTFTIDGTNVSYPVGTAITFVNETSQVLSIAVATDTLTLANSTTSGTRSLAQNGVATALKVTSSKWIISGVGLT